MSTENSQLKYLGYTFTAFIMWGLFPIYFKWLDQVDAFEIMAHRVVWSLVFMIIFMIAFRKRILLGKIVTTPALFWPLVASSLLIAINWGLYVWAVVTEQVLATSLGYFINPLVSVILGVISLSETLNRRQMVAVILVVIAIANMVWTVGELPWISLTLAISFGLYGLIRKQVEIDSFNGLLFEVLFIFPVAIGYLLYLGMNAELSFMTMGISMDILLLLSGILTIMPLVFFAAGVKGINLSTVGFIQYIAPSLSFMLAVFVFNEPFSVEKLISFVLIWTALALISFDAWRRHRTSVAR